MARQLRLTLNPQIQNLKILSLSKLNNIFEQVSLKRMEVFYFEVAVGEDMFDDEVVAVTIVDHGVRFSVSKNIKW